KVKFRRFKPFDVATDALQEGITPDGQKLEMTETEAEVKAYGKHVELTDEMQWAMLDNMHKETAELLADQAALTLDTLDRNVLAAGTSVQWAGGKASRSALTSSDKLTGTEIRNAVRTLKNANVKRFPDGCYHAIINPDIEFDLQDDPLWIDVAKYQDKEA
ncbi:MAG TPA: N4-gp56 family major capsid protein, partial [Clostridia bacterium]|nr:N4-gp56 family major capsid protein [Clostridia bacterium]